MRKINAAMTFIAVALLAASGCAQTLWQKGNIHTHSLWSDGDDFPEMIASWYRDHGYRFLALSDHNVLSRGERWMPLREVEKRGGAEALRKYVARFGQEWVELRGEGEGREVRLRPLAEFRPLLEKPGEFLMIEGEEISDKFERLPIHINATNLAELIPPQGGESVRDVIRRNLAAVREQAERTGRPILAHLNHPNFGWAITPEDLAHVVEEHFFEVYNGHPSVRHLGDDTHPGVERMWDIANTIRIETLGAPPLFGVATDDSHDYHGTKGATPGRGWIMVRSSSLHAKDLIAAMTRGDFYATSGVVLADVRFDSRAARLTVVIDPEEGAHYTTRFIGTLAEQDAGGVGAVLKTVEGTRATYELTGKELYVRAMIESSRPPANPVYRGQRRRAWTQPVGWRGRPVSDPR